MKRASLRTLLFLIAGLAVTGCAPAKFSAVTSASQAVDSQGTAADTVCDPFDPSNIVSGQSGLQGTIHFLSAGQAAATSSTDLIARGTKVNADLFLNRVFVPTRIFNTGFSTENGPALTDDQGGTLFEWFALDLKSSLKLGSGDSEGLYQLAILSDDGATLSTQSPSGAISTLIDNDGTHSTRMGCAISTISMSAASRLPIDLTYFQGPREHISLVLMWRKVLPGESLAEQECGQAGNEYFFQAGTATTAAIPQAPYQGLLNRGWKPLSAENFELQTGSNRCY